MPDLSASESEEIRASIASYFAARKKTVDSGLDIQSKQIEVQQNILQEVVAWRDRQDEIFGKNPRELPFATWLAILTEELGKVAKAILQGDSHNYRDELIQVAACAVAAVEDRDLSQMMEVEVSIPAVFAERGSA